MDVRGIGTHGPEPRSRSNRSTAERNGLPPEGAVHVHQYVLVAVIAVRHRPSSFICEAETSTPKLATCPPPVAANRRSRTCRPRPLRPGSAVRRAGA